MLVFVLLLLFLHLKLNATIDIMVDAFKICFFSLFSVVKCLIVQDFHHAFVQMSPYNSAVYACNCPCMCCFAGICSKLFAS